MYPSNLLIWNKKAVNKVKSKIPGKTVTCLPIFSQNIILSQSTEWTEPHGKGHKNLDIYTPKITK